MLIVITGPIASGKSTVARAVQAELYQWGVRATVVDLDEIRNALVDGGFIRDEDPWAVARETLARFATEVLTDGEYVLIADGSFNRPSDRATLERLLDGIRPFYVSLTVTYDEALRRAQGDPTRGVSRDPAFLLPYFDATADWSASLPATDVVIDTESIRPSDAAAQIARRVLGA